MAFPQFSPLKIVVKRGMALGRYRPVPTPTNTATVAKEEKVVAYLRQNRPAARIANPNAMERL